MNLLEELRANNNILLNESDDGRFIIAKYKNLGVNWDDPLVREARGLIIDAEGNIVGRPFEKFFNLNELAGRDLNEETIALSQADEGEIEVVDKLDGSLVITYYDKDYDELRFASSGSLESDFAKAFKEYAKNHWSKETYKGVKELSKEYTLMFEYIGLDNLIVVPYAETSMKLIGVRRIKDGKNYSLEYTKEHITKGLDLEYAEILDLHNLDEVKEYIQTAEGIEGVVVYFKSTGKRVKLKTEEYFRKHKVAAPINLGKKSVEEMREEVRSVLKSDDPGILDDILASYKAIDGLDERIAEIEAIRDELIHFEKQVREFAEVAEEAFEAIEGIPFYKLRLDETEWKYGYSYRFIAHIRKEYEKFVSLQKDFAKLMDAFDGTGFKKDGQRMLRELAGTVANYPTEIAVKSFVHKELDIDWVERVMGGPVTI